VAQLTKIGPHHRPLIFGILLAAVALVSFAIAMY
jgi:hypothetical protein